MPKPRLLLVLATLAVLVALAPPAHALDESGARLLIAKFLAQQDSSQGSAAEAQHAIHDLDGDGKPDLVLMWNVLGATWFQPKLTVFLDQGRSYRVLTADLQGMTEKFTVQGPSIIVDTLMPAPGDARCCPTAKKQLRLRWAGGKLTALM